MKQNIEDPFTLQSMPMDLLTIISCLLSPSELATLSVLSRRLREHASSPSLWRSHSLAYWPYAAVAVAVYYSGDWHQMFCDRAAMPAAFPAAVDKIHAYTVEAKESVNTLSNEGRFAASKVEPNTAIEQILRGVEAVKRSINLKPEIQNTSEYEGLQMDISWWLSEYPQTAIKFAKSATENFYTSISTGQRRSSRCDAEWKLDALEGLSSLALEQRVHLSVRRRLKAEIRVLRRLVEVQTA